MRGKKRDPVAARRIPIKQFYSLYETRGEGGWKFLGGEGRKSLSEKKRLIIRSLEVSYLFGKRTSGAIRGNCGKGNQRSRVGRNRPMWNRPLLNILRFGKTVKELKLSKASNLIAYGNWQSAVDE